MNPMNNREPTGRTRTRLVHAILAFATAGVIGFTASTAVRKYTTDATEPTTEEHGTPGQTPKNLAEPGTRQNQTLEGPGRTEPGRPQQTPADPSGSQPKSSGTRISQA